MTYPAGGGAAAAYDDNVHCIQQTDQSYLTGDLANLGWSDLVFSVGAGQKWSFNCHAIFSGPPGYVAGGSCGFGNKDQPAFGGSGTCMTLANNTGITAFQSRSIVNVFGSQTGFGFYDMSGNNNNAMFWSIGSILSVTSPGKIRMYFVPVTIANGNLILRAGSTLDAYRVG